MIEEAFKALDHNIDFLERAKNGEDAVERLANDNTPQPDLVLLDLNMPRMNGFEVLQHVRQVCANKTLRIVVLSTSDLGSDVRKALDLEANAYVTKATGFDAILTSNSRRCAYPIRSRRYKRNTPLYSLRATFKWT